MIGKIFGTNVSLTSGWNKLSAVFDLDKMEWSAKIDDTDVVHASNKLIWPENDGQCNLGLYRIGVITKGNSSWSIDNIKTGYLEFEILASTDYVKTSDRFNADKVVSFDAVSIKINVRKEYGELSNDVTVEITTSAYLAFYLDDELVALTPAGITALADPEGYCFTANEVSACYSKIKCFVWSDVTPLIKTIEKQLTK